jgi:hypothetical protein
MFCIIGIPPFSENKNCPHSQSGAVLKYGKWYNNTPNRCYLPFTFIERSIMHYTNYTLFSPNESEPKRIVKELSFPRYGALLLADFFECLSVGNFAQRCEICGKYFLTSIKKPQRYCNGLSNEVVNGSRLTCHQVAAKRNKKESSNTSIQLKVDTFN